MNATELGRMYRAGDLPGLLALCRTIAEKQPVKKVQGPDDLALNLCAQMGTLEQEELWVVLLNTRNEVLKYEIVQEGTLDHAVVYPRRIIEGALSQHASGLILVHNHPSGHCRPSNEDLSLTRNIVEAVRMIDIRILDHIVVGREGYFSFKENNLL